MDIKRINEQVKTLDMKAVKEAKNRWMSIGKPLLSLGKLEDAIIQIAGIKGRAEYTLEKKGLVIMCADNGIVAEGVTQSGQEVTAIVADNFTRGAASVCLMSQSAGVDVFPVDIGMTVDVPTVTKTEQKVAYGTKNFATEPAMKREQVWQAIQIGIEMVSTLRQAGYDILATGEMGIGNTTTSSAIASVLLNVDVEQMTGKGAGLCSSGLEKKIAVIRAAILKHQPNAADVIDVMAKVGGLDIAGLTGVFLGGAIYGVPIVIDGFISSVAALCAVRLSAGAKAYMLPSHASNEPGGQAVLKALGFTPFITCDMFLGEGSGAVALMPLLKMALQVYQGMSTFDEISIEQYKIMQ